MSEYEQSASNAENTTVNFFRTGINHVPKFFTIKAKCIRSRPSLMTRSAAFTTDGSLIFVLQANKISPWEIPCFENAEKDWKG